MGKYKQRKDANKKKLGESNTDNQDGYFKEESKCQKICNASAKTVIPSQSRMPPKPINSSKNLHHEQRQTHSHPIKPKGLRVYAEIYNQDATTSALAIISKDAESKYTHARLTQGSNLDVDSSSHEHFANNSVMPSKKIRDIAPKSGSFLSHGYKVTIVDWDLKIFVIDMISKVTCSLIRSLTDNYVTEVESSNQPEKSWRTLYTYTKMDIPICDVQGLPVLMHNIMLDITLVIGDVCLNPVAHTTLRPRSWKEPHLLMYQTGHGIR
jgi:hypothetical protein